MFIGISGYTRPDDKYDVVLPAVTSWTLDRRKKAAKKNNFSGGFSASVNKNDEYRFYSITWDSLFENDYHAGFSSEDTYESLGALPYNATIELTESNIYVRPITLNLAINTLLWIVKPNKQALSVVVTRDYKSGDPTIGLRSLTGSILGVNPGDQLVSNKARALGLLSLAGLSATGNTHLLRDFMGNLVKVIFQSPKYNALSGTDSFGQMYYDVKMDIDFVIDTASQNYIATKGIQVNVTNESLPKVSAISGVTGNYDMSNFFIKDESLFNAIQLSRFKSGAAYSLVTSALIMPYLPNTGTGGIPLLTLARKMGFFYNFISAGNQLNMKFVGKDGAVIRQDSAEPDIEITLDVNEVVYAGTWNAKVEYGKWDEWKVENTYSAGQYVTSGGKLYLCILDLTVGIAVTETKSWYKVPDGAPIVVVQEGKFYRLTATTSKEQAPNASPGSWASYDKSASAMVMKCLPPLASKLTNNDAIIMSIQPFAYQDIKGTPNKSSVLLRMPIIDGPIIPDMDLAESSNILKLASIYPTGDDNLETSYLGTSSTMNTVNNLKYYQNSQLGSSVLAVPQSVNTPVSWSYVAELYTPRYNIEQTACIVNYTVLDIRGTGNANAVISDGLFELTVNNNNFHAGSTFRFAKDYASVKVTGNADKVESSYASLLQSFNLINLDKMLIETILRPLGNNLYSVVQTAYWLEVKSENNGLVITPNEPAKSGLGITRKQSRVSYITNHVPDSDTVIKQQFTQPSAAQYVDLASSITYSMEPVSEAYIAKFFNVNDTAWIRS